MKVFIFAFTFITMRIYLLLFLFSIPALLSSCFEGAECNTISGEYVKINVYKAADSTALPLRYSSLAINNQSNTFLVDTLLSSIRLPLVSGVEQLTFYMNGNGFSDSILFSYSSIPRLINEDCGVEIIFDNLSVLTTNLDSVYLIEPFINDKTPANVKIYR